MEPNVKTLRPPLSDLNLTQRRAWPCCEGQKMKILYYSFTRIGIEPTTATSKRIGLL